MKKNKTENGREYRTANGMILKTKNAKKSWEGKNREKPEILHETRRSSFWLECYDEKTFQPIAKHVDTRDAELWLEKNIS